MKLGNKGWGYRIFVMLLSVLSTFLLVANHYLQMLIGAISK